MIMSFLCKITDLLPRVGGRIETQDFREFDMVITAGYIEIVVNYCSFQTSSWCWKLTSLHLPPLQLASSSTVDGNLDTELKHPRSDDF